MANDISATFELPKQYDHHSAESKWYKYWDENGFFKSTPNPDKKPFTIVIPPPNVTGALHLGHALNNSLQDILIRMRRMQGFETLWVPGTDHAGIATQAVVERRLFEEEGCTRHDLGRQGLLERIWNWKDAYEKRIIGQLKSLGCSCDWSRLRFTLDKVCARAVRHTFYTFFQRKLIYRGKRLVNWDCALQTAVSDDEVFYETVDGFFWYFRYPVINPQPGEPEYVTVATTRPETMLGDTAVAVHPDPEKELDTVEAALREKLESAPEKEKEEICTELEAILLRRKTLLPLLIKLRDMALAGRKVLLPLANREIPLVADTWAKPEMGTGCVKITPAHDPNDYEVGKRCNLPQINIMTKMGTLNDSVPEKYRGMSMLAARDVVVADLDAAGFLEKVEQREIELAHSDRSKTPIEPFLNDQWFVRMNELAQSAMDAVKDERVKIYPSRYTKRYLDWLSEKRDWPIGRQLWWGHQIPIWYCKPLEENGAPATEEMLKNVLADWKDVSYLWDEESRQWWICACESDLPHDAVPGFILEREEDVLDTWFSSALWPHSTLGWPEETPELKYYYPTSVLITSRDIITLWVARMVLAGLQNCSEVPFHNVFIHPKILDRYGDTMSKSKGNGVDPVDVMEKYGADSLRLGLSWLTTDTQDVRLPVDFECPQCGAVLEQTKENRTQPKIKCPKCKQFFSTQWAVLPEDTALPRGAVITERFEMARNFCNKLWNASRFAMMHLGEDFEKVQSGEYVLAPVDPEQLFVEDRWILSRLSTVSRQVTEALSDGVYHYADAVRTLYDFTWDEFCSFYVEMLKYRLQNPDTKVLAKQVLAYILDAILRMLHPFIPFITEEVWHLLGQVAPVRGLTEEELSRPVVESVMKASWVEMPDTYENSEIESRFAVFQEILRAVREIRARQGVPVKEEVSFTLKCNEDMVRLLEPMLPYFKSMAGANVTAWGESVEMPMISSKATGVNWEVAVDLSGFMNVEAELEKHRKQIGKLLGLVEAKRKKLENANFVSRAPENIVAAERASLQEMEEQIKTLEEVVRRLQQ
ncbi:MAG: valine--tRNA ligase [Planctomycetia bacterium]|nr:valine--tRNA ligase [Planctomycetia bacterium]